MKYRLSAAAQADLRETAAWTLQHFGARQALRYADAIQRTALRICAEPGGLGSRKVVGDDVFSFPMRLVERRARHVLVYRVLPDAILILRILHERMDVAGQVAPDDDTG
jgi:toxin ParE1/3/4